MRDPVQVYRYTYYRESGVMIFESRYYAQKYINEILSEDPENYWTNFSVVKDGDVGFLIEQKSLVKVENWQQLTDAWKRGKIEK